MMGRLNHDQRQFFYSLCLEEAVPDDHPELRLSLVLRACFLRLRRQLSH